VEAAQRGTVVMYLLSDAAQKELWPQIKPTLTPGKTLYFSHGFSIAFKEDTGACGCRDGKGDGMGVGIGHAVGSGARTTALAHSDPTSSRVGLAKSTFPALSPNLTGVVPPPGVDVVLVAPKGSGYTLRTLFLDGRGLNSSVAVHQVRATRRRGHVGR
jgi:ketol-acid reductoisomerase